jgi:drug/metabolite transporter (DMT)-like permease
MTTSGIILVFLSALCHTSWNILSKLSDADPMSFLTKALLYSAVIYFPLFILFQFYITYTPVYMICVSASGVFAGIYFFSLAKAYETGDISIAYPVARSFPILVLAWAGLLLDEIPSPTGVIGICLIISGCFLLPVKKFKFGKDGFSIKNYLNVSCLWAFSAAIFTSFYSLTDKYASIENTVDPMSLSSIMTKINYVYLQNLISLLIIFLILNFKKYKFKEVKKVRVAFAGFIFLISYSLILVAFVENKTAYVVSFRQLSIVLTAILSMILIEKRFSKMRLTGVIVIFAGVVLIAFS